MQLSTSSLSMHHQHMAAPQRRRAMWRWPSKCVVSHRVDKKGLVENEMDDRRRGGEREGPLVIR